MGFVSKIGGVVSALPPKHKMVFGVCLAIFVLSTMVLLWQVNEQSLVSVPTSGGEYTEGLLGTPRFINPLLVTSPVDRDLTALIYSGLMRNTPEGKVIPDLAESYTISPDNLTYEFTLKSDLVWHDGERVTADDVVFTINKAKEPSLGSPRRASLEGIEVEKTDERHLTFHLKQPYPLFLEAMAIGILPAHRWQKVATEVFSLNALNREPIGTGPYQVERVVRDGDDIPLTYTLTAFPRFALGEPKISKLVIHLYQNTEALFSAFTRGEIEAMSAIDPNVAATLEAEGVKILSTTLPRVFGIFFNQNQAHLFTRPEVRKVLNLTVDRSKIISDVFHGYAEPLTGPLLLSATTTPLPTSTTTIAEIMKKAGWQKNATTSAWELPAKKKGDESLALAFTLSTSDAPELKRVAELVKHDWEAVGVKVDLKIFEQGALTESVIRPREYEALLYGEVIGRNWDLYPFWHSTQRLDPGLNIALYTNVTVDKILDQIRVASTTGERLNGHLALDKEIRQDEPAVFLYAPRFLYVVPDKVEAIDLGTINTPSERFLGIYNWHIKTDRVWPIFVKD